MKVFQSPEELKGAIGTELGVSEWMNVEQSRVNAFADATLDHQWIHIDPEKAQKGPFGKTIAHGYLTLSLGPALLKEVWKVDGVRMAINYGLNKVRYPSPVPVDSKLRLRATLQSVEDIEGGVQVVLLLQFEVEGSKKPACVAEAVFRYYV